MLVSAIQDEILQKGPWRVRRNRRLTRFATRLCIREWHRLKLPATREDAREQIIREVEHKFGGFWIIIAGWIVSAIVQWLINKYMDDQNFRNMMNDLNYRVRT